MVAFEAINSCRIVITLNAGDHKGLADLMVKAEALSPDDAEEGLASLGSASASCFTLNRQSLEGAVLQLLYRLDSQLASGEFEKVVSGS